MKQNVWYIDHYDSFSLNVMDWLTAHSKVTLTRVFYDDALEMKKIQTSNQPIVLSPGPNHPQDIPQTIELIQSRLGFVPILGICLGHQALAFSQGFKIRTSENCFHGTKQIIKKIVDCAFLENMPEEFQAATYNSLVIDDVSGDWKVLAVNQFNEIQIIANAAKHALGIQFHPESFLSDDLGNLFMNILC